MELLEIQDPEKKKLIESSERHKRALEKELSLLASKKDRMVTNALVIGSTLALTYFVISSITKKTRKKKKLRLAAIKEETGADNEDLEVEEEVKEAEPSELGKLGIHLLTQVSAMLLSLAREKLSEYLESRKKNNEHS